jgi:hypothetical protein
LCDRQRTQCPFEDILIESASRKHIPDDVATRGVFLQIYLLLLDNFKVAPAQWRYDEDNVAYKEKELTK